MDPVAALDAAALTLALVAVGVVVQLSRLGGRLSRGETVIVCTRRPDDQSLHGVVVQDTRRGIVLEAAHLLQPDGDPVPLGRVNIDRPVSFVQRYVAHVDTFREAPRERPTVPLPDVTRPARLRAAPATGPR